MTAKIITAMMLSMMASSAFAADPLIKAGTTLDCSESPRNAISWKIEVNFKTDVPAANAIIEANYVYDSVGAGKVSTPMEITFNEQTGDMTFYSEHSMGKGLRISAVELAINANTPTKGVSSYIWGQKPKNTYAVDCIVK